jgi:hypothetical protein
MSTDAGSNYNVTKTSTAFEAFHKEDDTATALSYSTGNDLAQSTSFQLLSSNVGNSADESLGGTLTLFNPSSTTYVKHFIYVGNDYNSGDNSVNYNVAGYGNTTSAINAVQFKFASGNMDGTILMYGIV